MDRIRLSLLKVRKGISVNTKNWQKNQHEKIAAQRIGRKFNFILDTKDLWNLVVNYPCLVLGCDSTCEMNGPVEKVSLEVSESLGDEYNNKNLNDNSDIIDPILPTIKIGSVQNDTSI